MGRTYVISDVHGCYDQLMEMLDLIDMQGDDELYLLGDVIDRGAQSAEVVNWLVHEASPSVHLMLGNHELMMLCDTDGPDTMRLRLGSNWSYNDGFNTSSQLMKRVGISTRHAFYDMCAHSKTWCVVRYHNAYGGGDGAACLAHAGMSSPEQIDGHASQFFDINDESSVYTAFDMVWTRETWLMSDWAPAMTTVFGHTQTPLIASLFASAMGRDRLLSGDIPTWQPDVEQLVAGGDHRMMAWNGRIAIDCGCAYCGRLACLRLEDGKAFYVDGPGMSSRNVISDMLA